MLGITPAMQEGPASGNSLFGALNIQTELLAQLKEIVTMGGTTPTGNGPAEVPTGKVSLAIDIVKENNEKISSITSLLQGLRG